MRNSGVASKQHLVPALALRSVAKGFGGIQALRGVDFSVLPGEIHGLLGENGSGKSTLIKILVGYHAPDAGELDVNGEAVRLPLHPGQFRSLGLAFVHQDLGLISTLSVLENLRIGELATGDHRWHISWSSERRKALETFAEYGVTLDPGARVGDLPPFERALLAIVRAVEGLPLKEDGRREGVLFLDEPTVFLPQASQQRLFTLLRGIALHGAGVVFVSHNLDEVLEITDRITVLRDGRVVGTVDTRGTSEPELVEMIIGRRLEVLTALRRDMEGRETEISIDGLSGEVVSDFSAGLSRGEVLGVTGLAGSGFEELPYLLIGAVDSQSGTLKIDGKAYDLPSMTPARAIAAGLALVPADRPRDASIGSISIKDNVLLQRLNSYFRRFILDRRRMTRDSHALMKQFDVRPADPHLNYSSLSGGNQQKAVLAKWLQTTPSLFLLHEPTQGVDVGSRQQIFGLIREAASNGMSVIVASTDYEQLEAICDRVLVLGRGRVVQELSGEALTRHRIAEQCFNSVRSRRQMEAFDKGSASWQ
jgi:ribose transport system ATP-binding protein